MMKRFLTDLSLDSLKGLAEEAGLKPFAAAQIAQWIYQKHTDSVDAMTNISRDGRSRLNAICEVDPIEVDAVHGSSDGTRKLLCRAKSDGAIVECVLIPAGDGRTTVCISTQVGCLMGCAFCRTGSMGFTRNLTQGEIVSQLLIAMRGSENPVTNVVLMGMGEPLENYDGVAGAIRIFCDDSGLAMSRRRITLSTCGLIPELDRFSREFDVKIAISLNASSDDVRNRLMPINKKYPIAKIMDFCHGYTKRSRHRITFEYVMLGGVNDSESDAKRLVSLLKGVDAKINLIPFNPFEGSQFRSPDSSTVEWWSEYLYNCGIQTNIRASRGRDIMAACGQLAADRFSKGGKKNV
ncbi:MAG: Dual-specificity RNA methyltransferase RlmN [bacterium ADurb.Bin270]|nr:23S rRNA (adenine(2503)-C(2))-methyltransferase RlmN [Myxococcales bacterium]OQA60122.1 MAG: Dual-specificity RNA methyltransferase RlmN [bacterium ADurb.Bin270]HQG13706.1 23S rRNA (adenine(2503)-C(2))-methyltransferase RlmN [bacterium]